MLPWRPAEGRPKHPWIWPRAIKGHPSTLQSALQKGLLVCRETNAPYSVEDNSSKVSLYFLLTLTEVVAIPLTLRLVEGE